MKKSLIIGLIGLIGLLSPVGAMAQITHSIKGDIDENANAALKKATARFEQNVSFTVKVAVFDGQKRETLRQTAQVLYNKGKYRLSVSDQEVICDGTTLWHWNKTANEVVVNNMGTDDIDLMNPARLLANYGSNFKAKYIRTEDDGTVVVDLQPRIAQSYHKIRLLIDDKTGVLKRMEVHRYDSGREIYDITNFKRANTPAAQFTFDATTHPGVEVIDMR